ncbi:acyl-CoA dehydrogenase family protein [Streptomyces endophyticus]|uniref:Acyl-CoA dehydrogenase family protein n=1 Tax=Streptomyces endophyticus TaxID=714166 RepID=A0ABU6F9X0_9ACTN|nr:acyl-CoA dehydrogenase family protein [Streptomyces endophyticus]MEB8340839.1 acyl-CoA dehydrogenase family protein [Streptomyces endophyticus]
MTETLDGASPATAPDHPGAAAAPTVAGIRAAIAPVLAELAATARQREGTRDHPFPHVRALAEARLLLIGIAEEDGGAGGTLRDVAEAVIEVARADSNVAQALRASFLTAHQVATRHDLANRELNLERLWRAELFAGTSNERTGGASGSVSATVRRQGARHVVNGVKYYSTGGLYADWFSGTAVDEDGSVVRFTVRTDGEGVELLDDFDAVGQRLTASGSTRLTDAPLAEGGLVRFREQEPPHPWQGSFAQLYLTCVEAGIAASARDDAVWFGREKARPIKHSTADRSVDDPYVRHAVGRIAARAHAARSAVLLAAEALEAVRHVPRVELRAAGAAAAVTVAEAQYVAVESALEAAELLFDVGQGSATSREYALDRHWRNARTVANHNPRDWKAAVVGGYYLAAEEPPTSGLF